MAGCGTNLYRREAKKGQGIKSPSHPVREALMEKNQGAGAERVRWTQGAMAHRDYASSPGPKAIILILKYLLKTKKQNRRPSGKRREVSGLFFALIKWDGIVCESCDIVQGYIIEFGKPDG